MHPASTKCSLAFSATTFPSTVTKRVSDDFVTICHTRISLSSCVICLKLFWKVFCNCFCDLSIFTHDHTIISLAVKEVNFIHLHHLYLLIDSIFWFSPLDCQDTCLLPSQDIKIKRTIVVNILALWTTHHTHAHTLWILPPVSKSYSLMLLFDLSLGPGDTQFLQERM